jgi:hypothetical protein
MEYLAGLASISKGVLQEKVKVGTLYQAKYAFYWWNALFLDNFGTIYHKWHLTLMKWIHQVATEFQLLTMSYEKNNLTDTELSMMFRVVMDDSLKGVENYYQHYVVWVLAWVTATRPGSLTVSPGRCFDLPAGYGIYADNVTVGYAATDTLANGKARGFDETLRWSDVEFFKHVGACIFTGW